MGNLKYVGKSVVRQDGLEKITGAAQYVDDLDFGQHLLYAAIVESPHANAEILKINIKKAQGLEGVVRVVTGDEFPYRFGLYMHDRYIFAQQRVRFVGEQVAVGLLDHSKRLTLWTASQSPHTQRHLFAEALSPLGLTHKDIRVITPYVGVGFGGKAGVSMEILAAALATTVPGSPVKVLWNRSQEFVNTYRRQGVNAKIKVGVKNNGEIVALEQLLYWDAGAYVEYGANVVNAAGLSATGPYRIPNVKIDSVCVYTNLPPGGPYRGFGYSEFLFGLESHFNEIAKKLNIDPVEFREINAIKEGDEL